MMMSNDNVPSGNLTDDENKLLFVLVGSRKQTKATAVVEMFHAHPDRTQWVEFKTGVVCFVKDNVKKSYFIRLYDLIAKAMVYEQEVYNQFTYCEDRPYFHSFPGDKFGVGLNFADEKEASKFYQAVEAKLQEREVKYRDKRASALSPLRFDSNTATFDSSKMAPERKKLKDTVGVTQVKYRDLSRLGFDSNTATFDSSKMAPEWKKLIDTVGVTQQQLKDKDTLNFIYDFVDKRGGIKEANRQLEEAASNARPPPPPGRTANPPPPPARRAKPPLPLLDKQPILPSPSKTNSQMSSTSSSTCSSFSFLSGRDSLGSVDQQQ